MAIKQKREEPEKTLILPVSGKQCKIRRLSPLHAQAVLQNHGTDEGTRALLLESVVEPKLSLVPVGEEIPEGTTDLEDFADNLGDYLYLCRELNDYLGLTKLSEVTGPLEQETTPS